METVKVESGAIARRAEDPPPHGHFPAGVTDATGAACPPDETALRRWESLIALGERALEGAPLQDLVDAVAGLAASVPGVARVLVAACAGDGEAPLRATAGPSCDAGGEAPKDARERGDRENLEDAEDAPHAAIPVPGPDRASGLLELAYRGEGPRPEDRLFLQALARFLGKALAARRREAEACERAVARRLTELGSRVAHEVRNPLAGFQGVLDVLDGDGDIGGFHRDLIERTRRRLIALAERLDAILETARVL